MSDSEFRARIDFLRFLLIVGLVFLHYGFYPGSDVSPFRGYVDSPTPLATLVNTFVLFFFLSAVPLLSTISGYLFFRPGDTLTPSFYLGRYRSRIRSVLLPMISWNAFGLAIFGAIFLLAPQSPFLSLVSYDFESLTINNVVNALLGITRHPINFQFWFLRDLFLTVLLSPVLGLLVRHAPRLGLLGLGAVWLSGIDTVIFFRADVVFFFYLGALWRMSGWTLDFISERNAFLLLAAYVALVALRVLSPELVVDGSLLDTVIEEPVTRSLRLVGVVAFWGCSPWFARTAPGRWIASVGALAFFLHAVHWPLNQFIKAGLAGVLPVDSSAWLLVNYVTTTVLTVATALLIARAMARFAPPVFLHLSGGRTSPWGVPRVQKRPARAAEANKPADTAQPVEAGKPRSAGI
jgi:peptidoglycan/LPS O-acetylase OafA/YrhL